MSLIPPHEPARSVLGHAAGFTVSVMFYFLVFAVVGLLFRLADRCLRGWLEKKAERCAHCGTTFSETMRKRGG